MAKIVHQEVANKFKLVNDTIPYYKYNPQTIIDGRQTKLFWDRTIITDHTIQHNRPDILLILKKEKRSKIIEIGMSSDDNIHKMVAEKIRKYQNLSEELKQLYKLEKVSVLPLIISTNGLIPETTLNSIKELDLSFNSLELMLKAVFLGTASIVRTFMNIVD